MKNAFAGIVSRLDMTKGSYRKLKNVSKETPKNEKQSESL